MNEVNETILSQDDKTWGMLAHLSSLVGIVIPLGTVLGPLVVWLIKKDTMAFVNDQGKEALNFNITVLVAAVVSMVLGTLLVVILIGFLFYLLALAIFIGWLVLTILAGLAANKGESYRYPFTLRLIK